MRNTPHPTRKPLLRALVAATLLATPAAAQTFGQPQGAMPGGGGPSIVGTWSGQRPDPSGPVQQTDAFSPDGRFVSAFRLPNGFLGRVWGSYRSTQVSPNQLQLDFQAAGWLPQRICRQPPGGAPECQPFQIPTSDRVLVTFASPTQFQAVSQNNPGAPLFEARDEQAALLQAPAPQQWVLPMPQAAPPQTYGQAPMIHPYVTPGRSGPATNIPGLGGNCDDLQQRRICTINGGQLVRSGNCLRCVN